MGERILEAKMEKLLLSLNDKATKIYDENFWIL